MKIKSLSNILWILPFLSFIAGYQLLNKIYTIDKIATPNLVGKQLSEAIKITSANNLNLRIISEQIDHDLPENTIISQKPVHLTIKPNQVIFVVISKKANHQFAPNLCDYNELNNSYIDLKIKTYYVPNIAPKKLCIGQCPTAGQILHEQRMIAYLSNGTIPWVIMPNLLGLQFDEVKKFLEVYHIKFNVQYIKDQRSIDLSIVDQKPLAGTIINLEKLKHIELYVNTNKTS